jgi:hypothetical protein
VVTNTSFRDVEPRHEVLTAQDHRISSRGKGLERAPGRPWNDHFSLLGQKLSA